RATENSQATTCARSSLPTASTRPRSNSPKTRNARTARSCRCWAACYASPTTTSPARSAVAPSRPTPRSRIALKFGLNIGQQNISMEEMRRTWKWADNAGFDWVDVWDHFYEAPPEDGNGTCFEATTCMAAIACETRNVRIGVLVLGMNYRHPAILANALCTIDQLSGGRLEIGLGAGWHEPEYRAYGIPF